MKRVDYPRWSHDSQFVYFLLFDNEPIVERVNVATHKVEEVASLKGVQLTGYFNSWFGLTPQDVPLMLIDTGTDEIVSLMWHQP